MTGVQTCALPIYAGKGLVTVDMGAPTLAWDRIPLAEARDTRQFGLNVDGHVHSVGVAAMGNPHCVLFVEDAAKGWDGSHPVRPGPL